MSFFLNVLLLKITELLNDVERLKQALNGLSQLTYTSGIPSKRQNQQVEMLQNQVKTLQQQLAVSNSARCCPTHNYAAYSDSSVVCAQQSTVGLGFEEQQSIHKFAFVFFSNHFCL